MRRPPTSSFGGWTSPTTGALQRPPMRTTLPAGPDDSTVLLRTSNSIAGDPVYGRGSACSATCKHVVRHALRGDPQAPEVRGAADVQLKRGGFVRGRRIEVAAFHDLLQQPLVRGFAEGVRRGIGQQRTHRSGSLIGRVAYRKRGGGELERVVERAQRIANRVGGDGRDAVVSRAVVRWLDAELGVDRGARSREHAARSVVDHVALGDVLV